MLPPVAGNGLPFGPREGQEWHVGPRAGGDGVAAHLHREGVRRIDHMGNSRLAQVVRQSVDPAEPADPLRQGLSQGSLDPSGERYDAREPALGNCPCKRRRLGRAGEDQEGRLHG